MLGKASVPFLLVSQFLIKTLDPLILDFDGDPNLFSSSWLASGSLFVEGSFPSIDSTAPLIIQRPVCTCFDVWTLNSVFSASSPAQVFLSDPCVFTLHASLGFCGHGSWPQSPSMGHTVLEALQRDLFLLSQQPKGKPYILNFI